MRVVTLTTTKFFFERVASGVKRVEYRRDIPYYHEVYARKPRVMILHYRHGVYLVCRLRRVRYIDRPRAIRNSVFITTPRCFAFEIAEKSPAVDWAGAQRWVGTYSNQ
jgi:hypothetical protein